ncbi:hypothetical protein AMTRI_Chr09g39760 [Amborella trichopoda]
MLPCGRPENDLLHHIIKPSCQSIALETMEFLEEKFIRRMKGRGRNMKSKICIPRLRSNRLSPVSILERLREAILRLIMISAIAKGAPQSGLSSGTRGGTPNHPLDSHYSEAVADCIEFFKKSACSTETEVSTTEREKFLAIADDDSIDIVFPTTTTEPVPALPVR